MCKENIRCGMIIVKPRNVKSHIRFEAQVYNLRKEKGKRHSFFFGGYHPQFYIHTIVVTSKLNHSNMLLQVKKHEWLCWVTI
jgi:translation elongation factor EF-Tu-like GTPase